jgi:hypothetical protein
MHGWATRRTPAAEAGATDVAESGANDRTQGVSRRRVEPIERPNRLGRHAPDDAVRYVSDTGPRRDVLDGGPAVEEN